MTLSNGSDPNSMAFSIGPAEARREQLAALIRETFTER